MSEQLILTPARVWIPEAFSRDDGYQLVDQWNRISISRWAMVLIWLGRTLGRDPLPPVWMSCEEAS